MAIHGGNASALSLGLGKQLNKGDNLVFAAFGGGFTWGATLVRWAYDGASVKR